MVEKKEIFRKIDGIINELNDQYKYLSKNQDAINELELELFAANANFLWEHIKIIRKLNIEKGHTLPIDKTKPDHKELAQTDVKTGKSEEEEKEQTPAIKRSEETKKIEQNIKPEVKETEDLNETDEPFSGNNEAVVKETPVERKGEEEQDAPSPDDPVVNEVVIRERTVSIDTPVQNKLTKSSEHVPTVNDVMSAQRTQDTLGSNYSRQAVTDLKTIVSLNDKLLFVKDLFNGYNLAYSEAIELLNRFDNFNAADNFLKKNYSTKNNWAEKQPTVDKLYEILNRRFSK